MENSSRKFLKIITVVKVVFNVFKTMIYTFLLGFLGVVSDVITLLDLVVLQSNSKGTNAAKTLPYLQDSKKSWLNYKC